jgi:hypothetical protein
MVEEGEVLWTCPVVEADLTLGLIVLVGLPRLGEWVQMDISLPQVTFLNQVSVLVGQQMQQQRLLQKLRAVVLLWLQMARSLRQGAQLQPPFEV